MANTIRTADLRAALDVLAPVTPKRTRIDVLRCIRIEAVIGALRLTATNLDIEVQTAIPCYDATGDACYHLAALQALAARATETVTLADIAPSAPAADWPVMVPITGGATCTMSTSDLRAALDFTGAAMSAEETRYYLYGVYATTEGDALTPDLSLIATDGHRLHRARTTARMADLPAMAGPGCIIPRETVKLLARIAAKRKGSDVRLTLNSCKLVADFGDVRVTSRAIDGTFPDYARIIPKASAVRAEVAVADLQASAKVRFDGAKRGESAVVAVRFGDDAMTLEHVGTAGLPPMSCPASYPAGDAPAAFWVNARYLADTMAAAKGFKPSLASLEQAYDGAPVRIRFGGLAHLTAIIMPMRRP